jgi:hypothetical protein
MYSLSSVFCFFVLFFLRRLQNAALIAELQEPLSPLELTVSASSCAGHGLDLKDMCVFEHTFVDVLLVS